MAVPTYCRSAALARRPSARRIGEAAAMSSAMRVKKRPRRSPVVLALRRVSSRTASSSCRKVDAISRIRCCLVGKWLKKLTGTVDCTSRPAQPIGCASRAGSSSMSEFDVIVKDGIVVDGTGTQRYRADVGIRGGRIAKLGRLRASDGARVLDAGGMIVAPGFIDLHTHYDAQLYWDP